MKHEINEKDLMYFSIVLILTFFFNMFINVVT